MRRPPFRPLAAAPSLGLAAPGTARAAGPAGGRAGGAATAAARRERSLAEIAGSGAQGAAGAPRDPAALAPPETATGAGRRRGVLACTGGIEAPIGRRRRVGDAASAPPEPLATPFWAVDPAAPAPR